MLCVNSKRVCDSIYEEDNWLLEIAERMAKAMKRQREAMKAQWKLLAEMHNLMKQMA